MDSESKIGGAVIAVIVVFVAFLFADVVFAHHTTQDATIVALASEPEGGISGGTTHIAILDVGGRRATVFVRYATDFYLLSEGQQVTLHKTRGRFTGWYLKDWVEP